MRILYLVGNTARDALAGQRSILRTKLAAQGHEVRELQPPLSPFRLWSLLRSWPPEVIHLWHPPQPWLGHFLHGISRGSRLVVTVTTPPKGKRPRFFPSLERWLTPTPELAAAWNAWGIPSEQIKEITPALPAVSSPLSRAELLHACHLPPDAQLILCGGPFTTGAGHVSALWAMDILRYLQNNAFLLLCGTGPAENQVRQFAQKIGADRFCHFLGDHFPLADVLPQVDLVWEPTQRNEITDTALLAQACGKPLLAVGHSSLKPLVHPQAVQWLPPHDPPRWAQQTHHLLCDGERQRRMSQAGLQFAREHFCTETFVARHLKQYERLLATPARSWRLRAA
jgi:glycosyltransferase involved in cell wall biosynthesis